MEMIVKIQTVKQLGAIVKQVRQSQAIVQETAGLLSGNGLTFVSQFENGKETVEIGRVFKLLEQLGIKVELNLPPNLSNKIVNKLLSNQDITIKKLQTFT
ncbi:MAG: transcriptional regulator [Thalassotalea sp.]|nr:transcriptional regulator [Thalassotalea sp.]